MQNGFNAPGQTVMADKKPGLGMLVPSKIQAGYFTNWGSFLPTDVDPKSLTHIVYAFANISGDTGIISLSDPYADEQKLFPGDNSSDPGHNLYGCLKQFYLLKLKHRNLKTLLSVGGATASERGAFNFVTDATKRTNFVQSAVSIIENYGFDGLDVDFEFPQSTASGQGLAQLMTELRTAFNKLKDQKKDETPYLLTAAVSCGQDKYKYLDVPKMNAALNYWFVMAYDYSGSWLSLTDNQANLYGGGVSTDQAIMWYMSHGAAASKIVMGVPLYGRAFEHTSGLKASYKGVDIIDYRLLPEAGATVHEDKKTVSSYSYNAAKQEFVSYDTPAIVRLKAQYVQEKGLAGSMFWQLSQDKRDANSLVATTASTYGTLDQTPNHVHYPNSKWSNIKSNMGYGNKV